MTSPSDLLDMAKPLRDTEYYIDEENMAVILVDKTLYKVHRSVLVKDNSTFGGMFSLDDIDSECKEQPEGDSDDHPIRLQGDTTDEFRALLWALYALPSELSAPVTTDEDVLRFINLARITHKYQFATTEHWALHNLISYFRKPNAGTTHLVELTDVASLCESQELLSDCLTKWRRLLKEGRDISLAIGVGERLGLGSLTGLAYYTMLLRGRDHWDHDPLLSRAQRVRLLSGHYELVKECETLASLPPALPHDTMCANPRRCNNAWMGLWRVIISGTIGQTTELRSADLLGRVKMAENNFRALVEGDIPKHGIMDDVSEKCYENAIKAVQRRVKEIQGDLANYFTDVD